MQTDLEFGVEYYPNAEEGEQFEYLTHHEFLSLLRDHELRGLSPCLVYDHFTIFENGRSGSRLTIRDDYGLYYAEA
jgi:hypothetical protein